jgi:putative endonuclease
MDKKSTIQTGVDGENIACQFLIRKGYSIIERNYRLSWGEIDIIAQKKNELRFVEVKSGVGRVDALSRENEYQPEQLIHAVKIRKITRMAELYMAQKGDSREFQIDAVVVIFESASRRARCRLYEQIL